MTRLEQLINELRERKPVCTCGAVAYPKSWMTKTREKAVADGKLYSCECAKGESVYLKEREKI